MPIPIVFAEGPGGTAIDDYNQCMGTANAAQQAELRSLLYDYVFETLQTKSPRQLTRYLASRQVWQVEGAHSVFRTADQPSLAYFGVDHGPSGGIAVVVLGFGLGYPGFPDQWWANHIRPRLLRHI